MFALMLGNLAISNSTAVAFGLLSLFFLSSFIFISQNNDMVGALKSLLPAWLKGDSN